MASHDTRATGQPIGPDGQPMLSVPMLVEQYGVTAALRVMHAAGIPGEHAIDLLRRAGCSALDIEAACLPIEEDR